ncbi:MAG: phosphotransferase, partial [Pseudomonadota bacterium]|nr:phosphotransferase [Pseudomonadota bacterium]
PAMMERALDATARSEFFSIWDRLAALLADSPPTLVLRDYHSPNIIWRPNRPFPANLGLIDFQDAVLGPAAYDLASLAQDARVDIAPAMEHGLVDRYLSERRQTEKSFDTETFLRDYAIMAAQRATKVLGIFVRLDRRDGKPGYLRHLPRLRDYLDRSLAHPALSAYRDWCRSMPDLALGTA